MREHRTFFGDQERIFKLTAEVIEELERTTGRGIAGLCKALFNGDFRHVEIVETIRLALIGGGEVTPQQAASLVAVYVLNRPLAESWPLATAICQALYFGPQAASEDAPDIPSKTPNLGDLDEPEPMREAAE